MSDTPVVFLGQKGEIRQGKIKSTTANPLTLTAALKKKDPPELLGHFAWKQKTLFLFGYSEGKPATENQHHLPPPLEGITYFGDILVVASNEPNSYTNIVPLKTADYETFYTAKLEGEEEEEEEEEAPVEDVVADIEEESEAEDYGEVEEEEAVAVEEEPIEKPTRVSRAKKIIAAVVEEPEIQDTDLLEGSKARLKVYERISEIFKDTLEVSAYTELEAIIFKCSFDYAVRREVRKTWGNSLFQDIYLATARRIIGNMNPSSYVNNKNLWQRYTSGEVSLEEISKQNYYELCPEKWKDMLDQQVKREHTQLEGDFSRATDKWQCNGCKMRKCTYYELQTRSADEPMTLFIHCLNCGKRWTR